MTNQILLQCVSLTSLLSSISNKTKTLSKQKLIKLKTILTSLQLELTSIDQLAEGELESKKPSIKIKRLQNITQLLLNDHIIKSKIKEVNLFYFHITYIHFF